MTLARPHVTQPVTLLAAAARSLRIARLALWTTSDEAPACIARHPAHAEPPAPPRAAAVAGALAGAARSACYRQPDAEGVAVGFWRHGSLAGVLLAERGAGSTWTDVERASLAALADRLAGMLDLHEQEQRTRSELERREARVAAAEAALRTAERRFQDVFEQFPYSIQTFDTDGRTISVNPAYVRLWGFDVDGLDDFNILTEPQLEPLRPLIRRAFAGETVFVPPVLFDPSRLGPSASPLRWPRWIQASHFPIRDPEGRVREVMVVHEDVTERKEAEDALRASEASYHAIFDSSNDAIYVHDLETGAVLDANRQACELNGVTLEDLRTRGIELLGCGPPPFTPELALERLRQAAAGEPQRFEWCTLHAQTGEEMWVEVGLQRVTINGEDRLLALVRDIRTRKQTERALVQSEEAYRTIFQHSAEAIWVHDSLTGEMLDVNQAGCDMYGYTREEMMRVGHDALLYPGSEFTKERVGEMMARALAGESPRFEWMGRHKAGHATWGEVTLRRVTVSGRDLVLATARDIGHRKTAEEQLRRANEELERRVAERTAELAASNAALAGEVAEHAAARTQLLARSSELEGIFRALPDLYFRTEADGTVRDFRAGDAAQLVAPPELFIGRKVQEVLPAVGPQVDAALHRLALTAELVTFEYRLDLPIGTRDFEARFVPLEADQVIIVVRDITERKRAEEALRASEEHFRRMIENTSDQLMIIDRDGRITYVGPSIERLLGRRPEELAGQRPEDLVHPEDAHLVRQVLQELALHPGETRAAEYRVRHADGSWRAFETIARTLSPSSAAEGFVANGRDITERRRAEEALREASLAAEQANRAKSEFLSRMSHELRTPMNSILGFAQVLEGEELPARQERCVQHILRAGHHLLRLINEVLEISRIEAGRQNLSLEPVRLGPVLQEAVSLARPMAAQARVDIEYDDCADPALHVHADRQRLSQVLLNLLSNAIKYNRPGGRVRVRCAAGGEPGQVRVRVADTGRGIAPERRAELFTPFARLGAENGEVEGTGLGLALSLRLTEAMGGRLELEQSGAEGSVFAVELQRTLSPVERLEEGGGRTRARGAVPHDPATLLYVEDNLANLALVETILWERPRWRTIPALQGQIGVELAREHLPDAILLDLHLPDIRGEEVIRRLREDERTARIPVIVITADATAATADRLLGLGAAAFLTKPLDVAEFLATVERTLALRNLDEARGREA